MFTAAFHDANLFLVRCHVIIGKNREGVFFFEQGKLKDKIKFSSCTALKENIIRKISINVFLPLPAQS